MAEQIQFVLKATDATSAVVDKVRGSFGLLEKKANDLRTSFGSGLTAQITAALAPAAVVAFVTGVARGIDALNDLSDATGASVENISALENVAARTGTSFDAVGTSLVKFNAALNEAKPGSQVSEVLKSLGLDAKRLKELDPAEALRQTAIALSRFADDGNKARAVQELFGKSLREVAPFLKDLATQGELVATVTSKQAAEAEKFAHSLDALAKNSKDSARSLVGDLLPALNNVLETFQKFGVKGTLKAAIGTDELGELSSRAKAQSTQLTLLGREVERWNALAKAGVSGAAELAAARTAAFDVLSAKVTETTDKIKKLTNAMAPNAGDKAREDRGFKPDLPKVNVPDITKGVDEVQKLIEALEKQTISALDLTEVEKVQLELSGRLSKARADERDRLLELARGLDLLKSKQPTEDPRTAFRRSELEVQPKDSEFFLFQQKKAEAAAKAVQELIDQTAQGQINELAKQYSLLADAQAAGTITAEQYIDALEILDEKFGKLTAPVKKATEEMSEFAKQAARNIQDALGTTLEDVLAGNFRSIGRLWSDLLRKMVAQALAAQLNEALFGKDGKSGWIGPALDGFFKGVVGGASGAGASPALGAGVMALDAPRVSLQGAGASQSSVTIIDQRTVNVDVASRTEVARAMSNSDARQRAEIQRMYSRGSGVFR